MLLFFSLLSSTCFCNSNYISRLSNIALIYDEKYIEISSVMEQNGELLVVKSLIKDHDIVFDIGAHVGEWANYVKQYHKKAKLILFEPLPYLYKKLSKKFFTGNVFSFAVSNNNNIKSFTHYPKEPGLSSIYARQSVIQYLQSIPEIIQVKTITLDNFCRLKNIKHIDFLKIDTEGSEYDVLRGSLRLIKSGSIGLIQFEYGGTYIDADIKLKEVYDLLQTNGYLLYRITSRGLLPIPAWNQKLEDFQYANYLAVLSR